MITGILRAYGHLELFVEWQWKNHRGDDPCARTGSGMHKCLLGLNMRLSSALPAAIVPTAASWLHFRGIVIFGRFRERGRKPASLSYVPLLPKRLHGGLLHVLLKCSMPVLKGPKYSGSVLPCTRVCCVSDFTIRPRSLKHEP